MRKFAFAIILVLTSIATNSIAQDCSILSKANDILPDRLCSPVTVNWEVSYRGVNDGGALVQIQFDWDDGSTSTINAINTDPNPAVREWSVTTNHVYPSIDDKCNYHPEATLIVDGQVCSSSSQPQTVTVWDNDNNNGGELLIDPETYPICVGNGANVQFQDNTQFNCVPPQENDMPNTGTRWIQWIYGTDITMTGTVVTIDGAIEAFPYTGNIITLPGPVLASGELSQTMNVANDKLVGQYFEVTLRYWNYCNPYDDPIIPGGPADPINGDFPPEITTARILIVDKPDATINVVNPICEDNDIITLSAASSGGIWSGPGIINPGTGTFSPLAAGPGNHTIQYSIIDANGCSDIDNITITVLPSPDGSIDPAGPFCIYNPQVDLNSAASVETWSGPGITNVTTGFFDPGIAGIGLHTIGVKTGPDANGCIGSDELEIEVLDIPSANFLDSDTSWCSTTDNSLDASILIEGSKNLSFDLTWEVNGSVETIFNIATDTLFTTLNNQAGNNLYRLLKIVEYYNLISCETILDDSLTIDILDNPIVNIIPNVNGICSPVIADLSSNAGYESYIWNFGDGESIKTDTSFVAHSYYYFGGTDTMYTTSLIVESKDGCIDSANTDIQVYPSPLADFFASPQVQNFPNTTVQLSNLSSFGNWSYLWDFDDGETESIRQPVEHEYETYGIYEISLIVSNEFCNDSLTKEIQILPPIPEAGFTPDTAGCPPMRITFRNHSLYGDSYIWDFDDGTFSTEENPTHLFYQPKTHNVTLRVVGLSGVDQETHTVTVYVYPQSLFNAYPTEAGSTDQLIRFVNNSQNAARYLWDFGDGNSSTETDPSHVYGKVGEFDVSLYTWSEENCPDTLTIEKYISIWAGEGVISYPNVFKWNGSGPTGGYWNEGEIDNTVFHPHFINVVEYQLLIYSRWGELLYESDDLYKGWDGYLKGKHKAGQGVYVYKAVVKYIDGSQEVKIGDVTFLH